MGGTAGLDEPPEADLDEGRKRRPVPVWLLRTYAVVAGVALLAAFIVLAMATTPDTEGSGLALIGAGLMLLGLLVATLGFLARNDRKMALAHPDVPPPHLERDPARRRRTLPGDDDVR